MGGVTEQGTVFHQRMTSILLVDDDRELDQMLTEYLSAEGFKIATAFDGLSALKRLAEDAFDLMLLDVMLPSLDGFDVLRNMRKTLRMPVIMLTARGADLDRIQGLELGADDYLPKPFNPRELVARIRAILRRTVSGAEHSKQLLAVGPLQINTATFEATIAGNYVRLTGTEFRVLESLMQSAGQIQSREVLTQRVLGRKLTAYDRSIDTHVSNLRRKLGGEQGEGIQIRNMRGLGYVLVGEHEGGR